MIKKERTRLLLTLKILTLLFGCLLLCVSVLLINSRSKNINKSNKIVKLKEQLKTKDKIIESYEDDINRLIGNEDVDYIEEKLEFFDDNIVFVIKGFGNYYYSYDCMMEKVIGSYTYWAYNIEKAEAEGFIPGGC